MWTDGSSRFAHRTLAGLPAGTAAGCALVFGLAVAGYLEAWPEAPVLQGDSAQYLEVARDLTDFEVNALHDRPPGYPLLLVLSGSADLPSRALFLVSLILHVAAAWLLATVLYRAGAGSRVVLLFCALLALPLYVEPAAHVMTETLAEFALAVAFTSAACWRDRPRRWLLVAAGFAVGYAALTRPVYQALAVALAGCPFAAVVAIRRLELTPRTAAGAGVLLIAASAVPIGMVAVVNYRGFGYFGLVPTAGLHLSTKTIAIVERLPDEYAAAREILVRERNRQLTQRGGTHTGTQAIWHVRQQLADATGLSNVELSQYLLRMNLALIRRAPLEYLDAVARSAATYWFPPSGPLAAMHSSVLRRAWIVLWAVILAVFVLQLVVLSGITLFEATRQVARRHATPAAVGLSVNPCQLWTYLLAATIVFYTATLSCFLDIGEVRQRRPTDPLMLLMTVLGVLIWAQSIRAAHYLPDPSELRDKNS